MPKEGWLGSCVAGTLIHSLAPMVRRNVTLWKES